MNTPSIKNSGIHCILLLAFLFMGGCEKQQKVVVIKLAHGLNQEHPVHQAMTFFSKTLEEKSEYTMRVDVYPNGQLGTERECVELLQMGGLGMTKVSSSTLEGFAAPFRVFGLPYLFHNEAHRWAVLNGDIGREILHSPTSVFLRGLCYYDAGSRSFYTTSKEVFTPKDLTGLKIRVQESPIALSMVKALGGSPTPIAWGELYTALQQGVVDGAENNPPSFYTSRHYELCKFYTLDEHSAVPDIFIVSTHLWDKLNSQQQQWVQEAANQSAALQKKLWAASTAKSLAEIQKAGVQLIKPDKSLFQEKVAVMIQEVSRQQPEVGNLAQRIHEVQP